MTDKLRVLDLFAGIGGFSLGLERAGGFETVAFCEIEPYPRRVLAKHWPGVPQYEDVRQLTKGILDRDGITVDVITGGFPCQDISVAGRRAGIGEGTRSGLWSEIIRLASELRPRYIIVENVANLLSGPREKPGGWFGRILGDLAECGYDAEWRNIPACMVAAPHRRERVWIVAHSQKMHSNGCNDYPCECVGGWPLSKLRNNGRSVYVADPDKIGLERPKLQRGEVGIMPRAINGCGWLPEPPVGRVVDGVPNRVDRLGSIGNAVVPQIPELIGRAIMQAEGITP